MNDQLLEPLVAALRDSEFLRTLRAVRADGGAAWALGGESVRALHEREIADLAADGNTAEDWRRVRVAVGFRPGRVRHCEFRGYVTLGRFDETARARGGVELPTGLYRSTLSNCAIGHEALVRNVGLLADCAVGPGALVSDCGRVCCDGPTAFGTGTAIPIGPQTGGRWLRPFAELTFDLAAALTAPGADPDRAARYADLLAEYLKCARGTRAVIGAGASVTGTAVTDGAFVGAGADIDGATRVERSALLSSPAEPVRVRDGACVSDSVLQWGTEVRGPAIVARAVLLERSAVEPFAKVSDSVIGPNSGVGGAEVTASLVGPFVGCHHTALLIAARWAGGRGNLGYGAAVGCNHTSRAPDQEALLGEGLFVGLGTQLQYPANFERAPYTVLAAGLTLPAQRVAFPFALVRAAAEPVPDAPPGAHVLVPAWVLSDNLYAVQRGALKFRARDRAARHRLEHEPFRPEVMALVADARARLEAAGGREVYTEADVPGLGRNVLLERHRVAAVRAYAEHLDRFHLLQLLERAERGLGRPGGPDVHDSWHALARLPELLGAFGAAVERSKARDEARGPRVVDDYASAHAPTGGDPVVRQTWDEVRRLQQRAERVLAALGASGREPARAALASGS